MLKVPFGFFGQILVYLHNNPRAPKYPEILARVTLSLDMLAKLERAPKASSFCSEVHTKRKEFDNGEIKMFP